MHNEEDMPDTAATLDVDLALPYLCRYLSSASPLALVAVEGGTHLVRYVNAAFSLLIGKEQAQLIGRPFAEAVPEGEANGCLALLDRVYSTHQSENLADQEHACAQPKPVFWSYVTWGIVADAEHPAGVIIQVTDTTEAVLLRQQATALSEALLLTVIRQQEMTATAEELNARLERAMEETHHRVKNSLQIVSALVEMQIGDGEIADPVAALNRIASYIKSLALLHDLLTQKVKSHFDDDTLSTAITLSQLLPLLQSSLGSARHLVTEVADIELPAFKIVSLSLLINELITNAAKHCAGNIVLSLVEDGTHAVLQVKNDGDGFPLHFDPIRNAHTGMGLILSFARHDLRGTIEFANPPEGGACVLVRFPIPAK